ncbi:hypothetical protein AB0A73_09880 [Glycomyces sp. NPDC047369]
MTPMLSRAVRIGCAAGLAALALAACGDDDADATDAASSSDGQFAAYTACLEEQGIDLPDDWSPFGEGGMPGGDGGMPSGAPTDMPSDFPTDMPTGDMPTGDLPTDMPSGGFGGGGGFGGFAAPDGVDEDDWTAATEACADELPQGMPGGQAPAQQESATDETTEG